MLTNRSSTPEPPHASQDAFRALLRCFGLLKRVMEPLLAQYGVSVSQWAVLRVLLRAEQEGSTGLRLKDVGRRLLIRPPSVTGVVRRLERQRLVTTQASRFDQRSRLVSLSPKGRELLQLAGHAHSQKVRAIMGALDDDEQQAFVCSLTKLADHLEDLSRAAGSIVKEKA